MNANTTTTTNTTETTSEATAGDGSDEPGSCPGEPSRPAFGAGESTTEVTVIPGPSTAAPAVDVDWIGSRLRAAVVHVGRPVDRVTVRLVDDDRMARLHRDHSGIDGTTDVLTFDAAPEADGSIDVDIAVCVDEARRNAASRQRPIEQELLLYALHGVLHCAGFDDHTDDGFGAMHAEEDRILELIGVGRLFADEPGGATDE